MLIIHDRHTPARRAARANTHVIYRKLPPLPEPNLSERPLASLIILSRDLSSNSRPESAMSLL